MPRILDAINAPSDLKLLTIEELKVLADETRAQIIATTSKTGGHVASSLGAVEIILAVHSLIDSPRDKFVFDVGHQAYAHKLVTGRREAFDTLRAHRDWFVTRRCGATFGGYATQQLRRIENALNREDPHLANQNAIRSVKSSIESISDRYPSLEASSFEPIERDGEVVLSGQLKEADLAELKAFAHECNESVKTANDLATRNIKRPSGKLAKHASHLIRLLRMGAEMLETGAITPGAAKTATCCWP